MGHKDKTQTIEIHHFPFHSDEVSVRNDHVAQEEPLEIRLVWGLSEARLTAVVAITMRTPGADFDLSVGFLYTENIISSFDDVEFVREGKTKSKLADGNIVEVHLKPAVDFNLKKLQRNFYVNSSCGVCGKTSMEAVFSHKPQIEQSTPFAIKRDILGPIAGELMAAQSAFSQTGGLHAVGLFNSEGRLLYISEDVGRHNAMDKLIGKQLSKKGLHLTKHILLLSGRASFELIQKAFMANLPCVVALGAPSSLAISMAREANITLIGFLKADRFNLYNHGLVDVI